MIMIQLNVQHVRDVIKELPDPTKANIHDSVFEEQVSIVESHFNRLRRYMSQYHASLEAEPQDIQKPKPQQYWVLMR